MLRAATILTLTTLPAAAEVVTFEPGQKLMITAHYENDSNTFSSDVPPKISTACFQVDAVMEKSLTLTLVQGSFEPWWAEAAYGAGDYTDTWFNSNSYNSANPNARPLDELRATFTVVPTCPGARSS